MATKDIQRSVHKTCGSPGVIKGREGTIESYWCFFHCSNKETCEKRWRSPAYLLSNNLFTESFVFSNFKRGSFELVPLLTFWIRGIRAASIKLLNLFFSGTKMASFINFVPQKKGWMGNLDDPTWYTMAGSIWPLWKKYYMATSGLFFFLSHSPKVLLWRFGKF